MLTVVWKISFFFLFSCVLDLIDKANTNELMDQQESIVLDQKNSEGVEDVIESTNQQKKRKRVAFDEDDLTENVLLYENSKGQNTEGKDKPYSKKHKRSSSSILNNRQSVPCETVHIVKNGGRTGGAKLRKAILTVNTCSFDSIFQILLTGCTDYDCIRFITDEIEESEFADFLKYALKRKVAKAKLNDYRNKILLKILNKNAITEYDKFINIDANDFIATMYEKICKVFPSLLCVVEKKSCTKCEHIVSEKVEPFVRIKLKTNITKDICNVQDICDSINDFITRPLKKLCDKCNSNMQTVQQIDLFVTLDLEGAAHCTLNEIPKIIPIGAEEFVLLGAVEALKNAGHFIPHVYRSNKTFETHDDLYPEKKQIPQLNKKKKIVLLIYFGKQGETSSL